MPWRRNRCGGCPQGRHHLRGCARPLLEVYPSLLKVTATVPGGGPGRYGSGPLVAIKPYRSRRMAEPLSEAADGHVANLDRLATGPRTGEILPPGLGTRHRPPVTAVAADASLIGPAFPGCIVNVITRWARSPASRWSAGTAAARTRRSALTPGRSGANCGRLKPLPSVQPLRRVRGMAAAGTGHQEPAHRPGPQWGGPAGELTSGGGGSVTDGGGGSVTDGGGGSVTGGSGAVVTGGSGVSTGGGDGVVTGGGGVLVTGPGVGGLCSAGGGASVADLPGSGAVVGGGTAAGAVGAGDGWGASAGPSGVTGTGSAGVPAGAGVPPASSPVPAAWDWLAVAGAGVMPGGSGGMPRSGRPGPPGSPPLAAGTVMVTAAPGRACTDSIGAVCHSHSATPVVATATVAVGASSHGDSSHPNRSRRGRRTRGGSRRGGTRRGGTDVVVNQSPNASDWPTGHHPPESGSGGLTGAAGRSRTGRRRTPAVRALPGHRRGGSRCARRAGR